MLGVDRLDMIKGIPQKLLAFEKFLEENPELGSKTLLVQIAVPSRTDVPEYQVGLCVRGRMKGPWRWKNPRN
jgi:trehalose 6-phosphate synthase/phosphatase